MRMRFHRLSPTRAVSSCALLLWATGCSTLSTPALRHETGEALGPGRIRVAGSLETNRAYAFAPAGSAAAGVVQEAGAFTGSHIGLMGGLGIFSNFEGQ